MLRCSTVPQNIKLCEKRLWRLQCTFYFLRAGMIIWKSKKNLSAYKEIHTVGNDKTLLILKLQRKGHAWNYVSDMLNHIKYYSNVSRSYQRIP
jgi:hypothetical protein